MIRTIPKIALLVGALAVAGQASAHGGGGWVGPALLGGVIGGAIVGSMVSRPAYVEQPVYVQPAPVYVQQPPPVYVQPAPVYVQPAPVYVQGGYYGRPVYYGHPHHWHDGPRW